MRKQEYGEEEEQEEEESLYFSLRRMRSILMLQPGSVQP